MRKTALAIVSVLVLATLSASGQNDPRQEECQDLKEKYDSLAQQQRDLTETHNNLVADYNRVLEIAKQQEKFIEDAEKSVKSLEAQLQSAEPSVDREVGTVESLLKDFVSIDPLGRILVNLMDALPVAQQPEPRPDPPEMP